jgi:uncharacterized membrane protein
MTRWFYLALVMTLVSFAASGYFWLARYDELPPRIPTHWNVHGQADGWTPKEHAFSAFFLLPTFAAVVLLLTPLLPWLSPRHFRIEPFRPAYGFVMALGTCLLAYVHCVVLIGVTTGQGIEIGRWLVAGISAFFALVGGALPRVERNFWVGVRTPWTIASPRVWRVTHQLAGWLFGLTGVAGVAIAGLGAPLQWCFIGVFGAALVPVVFSLFYYKSLERRGLLDEA